MAPAYVNKGGKESRASPDSSLGTGSLAPAFILRGQRCHRVTELKKKPTNFSGQMCVSSWGGRTHGAAHRWVRWGWPPPRGSGEGIAKPQENNVLMDFKHPGASSLSLHLQVSSARGRTNPTAQSVGARKTLGEGIPGVRGHLSWTEGPRPAPRPHSQAVSFLGLRD